MSRSDIRWPDAWQAVEGRSRTHDAGLGSLSAIEAGVLVLEFRQGSQTAVGACTC